jgi:plasmid maintenance system antidote protein VapI
MNRLLRLRIIEMFDNQAMFAAEIGAHESYVSAVLHGRRKLPPEAQDHWAKMLGTTPEALGLREYHK